MMDGVSTMDTGNNGQMLQMNVEAIAEVKVLTSGYQAEYGRSSGLQITAVTKSGTNRIRGSFYDVERNSDWNENTWANVKNNVVKTIQKERDLGYSIGGPIGKPGGNNKLFFFYSHEYRPRESGSQVNRFRVPTAAERAGNFSQSTDQNGAPIPNLFDFTTGGTFPGKTIPQERLYQPGLAILNLWPLPNTTGLNYNYEVELPTVNTLIQQPAVRLDYQPKANWRVTGKYAGQMRSHEVNSIGGAAAPGVNARIPGFNDYVEPYPWIGTISVTNNFTLNNTTFLEATYGWVQNQLGSMITTPVSNRFNAGLGGLPLLYNDAGVVDPRYYEIKPLAASGTPYFQDGRILLPPTFAFGNRVANAPPSLGFPGFMNVNRTQDFSISLTKLARAAHVQSRVLPEPQLQSAESGRRRRFLVPGRDQLRQRRGQSPRHRVRLRERGARRLHELPAAVQVRRRQLHLRPDRLVHPGQLEGQLEADARLRAAVRQPASAVRPVPAVVQLLPGAVECVGGAGAVRRRLRQQRQSLLGQRQSPGEEPADRPVARTEHVAGDRPDSCRTPVTR